MRRPRAAVLVSGSELVDGRRRDANGHFLAGLLAGRGLAVEHLLAVPDDLEVFVEALRYLLARGPEVLVTSGGLGTTHDDLTAAAVAAAAGVPLEEHPEARRMVEERTRGVAERRRLAYADLLPQTLKSARLPRGAWVIVPAGLAPGFGLEVGATRLYAFPGVPAELHAMVPAMMAELDAAGLLPVRVRRTLRTWGVGEIQVATLFESLPRDRIDVAITAGGGEVSLVVDHDPDDAAAAAQADALVAVVSRDTAVYSTDGREIDAVVADGLRDAQATVAVAESCTGGLLGGRLTELSGSSDYLLGGVIAYADQVKMDLLDVPAGMLAQFGAVSEEVAAGMAQGVRAATGATYGVSLTGVAGPAGGSAEKPVGLVYIGRDGPGGTHVVRQMFPGDRAQVRRWATTAALHLLREALAGA